MGCSGGTGGPGAREYKLIACMGGGIGGREWYRE